MHSLTSAANRPPFAALQAAGEFGRLYFLAMDFDDGKPRTDSSCIGCLMLIGIAVFVPAGLFCRAMQVKYAMLKSNRTISKAELVNKIDQTSGTLIIESTTLSWGFYRAWWTDDDISRLCPVSPLTELEESVADDEKSAEQKQRDYEFTKWVCANYTDLKRGKAKLVAALNGLKVKEKLAARFPHMRHVYVWSGGLDWLKFSAEEDSNA